MSLDRCDRCDLLVGLEDFHLMSVARTPQALVLDIKSCDRCAGCPGYGVNRSRSRARGGGGDRRALGPTLRKWKDPLDAYFDTTGANNAPKPSTDIIELGRRTARGYPNPTNYQPRILLIA